MELKCDYANELECSFDLLIVPYGIEIRTQIANIVNFYRF